MSCYEIEGTALNCHHFYHLTLYGPADVKAFETIRLVVSE